MHVKLTVSNREQGWRLDHYVTEKSPPWLSRSQVKRIINEGKVQVNETPRKPGHRLKTGDVISFTLPAAPRVEKPPEGEEIPLSILYEDDDIIVVDKPAGMIVHPVPRRQSGTLVNALLAHCDGLQEAGGTERPGIVHRLDKETSGVMVVAKTTTAHISLSRQFKSREVGKSYFAIVRGKAPANGEIDVPLARHPVSRLKMKPDPNGKPALTIFSRVCAYSDAASAMLVRTETGRTHQIRVHFKYLGFPLLGDQLYGRARQDEVFSVRRQMLHALSIAFAHPVSKKKMRFVSRIPHDMARVLLNLSDLARS